MYTPFEGMNVYVYLAPAGAGKTFELVTKVTEALEVYRPDEIAYVTFTRKGVENGIQRILKAVPHVRPDDLIHASTLHAMCFREAGLLHKNIIERSDIEQFNELLGFNVKLAESFENTTDDDKLLQRYDALRAGSKRGVFVEKPVDQERYTRLVNAYEKFKKENDLVDFYDCLIRFKDRALPVSVKVAFIDEAQDLTPLQWEVCDIAFSECEAIHIAGDDYQSLFSYAGASPETLINLSTKHNTIKLERTFRLPKAVYRFSKGITNLIRDKVEKDFVPVKDTEGFVKDMPDRVVLCRTIKSDMDKNGAKPGRWYMLFRNNCFIDDMTALLEQFTIPYHTSKGFCIAAKDIAKLKRFFNYRKMGYGTESAFKSFCDAYSIKDINDDFTESGLIPGENRYMVKDYLDKYGLDALEKLSKGEPFLLLSTTHRVKGGEADFTAVFLDCTKLVSENMTVNLDEELRVLYVACTRAREGLYLVPSQGKYGMDRIIEAVKETSE